MDATEEIREMGIKGTSILEFGGNKGKKNAKGIADVLTPVSKVLYKHNLMFEVSEVQETYYQTSCHTQYTDRVIKFDPYKKKEIHVPNVEYASFIIKGKYNFVNREGETTNKCMFLHQDSATSPRHNGAVIAQTAAIRTFLLFNCGIPTMDGEDHDKYKNEPEPQIHNGYKNHPNHTSFNIHDPEAAAKIYTQFMSEAYECSTYKQVMSLWTEKYLDLSRQIPHKPDNFQSKINEIFNKFKEKEILRA